MHSIARIEELIEASEETLSLYLHDLETSPNSLFAKGMVKNTEERLEELRYQLKIEKTLREKEVIELRLKGKNAKQGRLNLGVFTSVVDRYRKALTEVACQRRYGSFTEGRLNKVNNEIKLKIAGLLPGSARVIFTGETAPDLFGNSTLEEALKTSFELFQVQEGSTLLETAQKTGKRGLKNFSELFDAAIDEDLEVDFHWRSPNGENYFWEGTTANMSKLRSSISTIEEDEPTEEAFSGILFKASLSGEMTITRPSGKKMEIKVPEDRLELLKVSHLGQLVSGHVSVTKTKSTLNLGEKVRYELKSIIQ